MTAAVTLLVGVGCSKRALRPGEARLVPDGRVQARSPGETWRSIHGETLLHDGDTVQVIAGAARIDLPGARALTLRKQSQVEVQAAPVLLSGDLLVTVPAGSLRVTSATADVTVSGAPGASGASGEVGAARLLEGTSVVGVYEGTARVTSAGTSVLVPALRQVGVPALGLVDRVKPLDYRADDAWDERFLGDAIELGDELVARSRGFTAQLAPDQGQTAGFYRSLLPALTNETGFSQSLLDATPGAPGERLVGAAIAADGRRGTFAERWSAVFGFRNDGAQWGLVAKDQDVGRVGLLSDIDAALGRATVTPIASARFPITTPVGPTVTAPATTVPSGPTPTTIAPGNGGGNGGGGGHGPPTTTTTVVPTIVTGTPLDPTISGATDALNGLLGPVVGGVAPSSQSSSSKTNGGLPAIP